MSTLIETDGRSRAVIPGHKNQRFLLQENEDGSLLLQPASVVTDAQLEYDGDPELRALLAQAQARSTPIMTAEGIRLRPPVAGHPPYKVFWSSDGPRIEAVFPHP